jgi:uncharacterized coiled-coil protein SlyX
MFGKAKAQRRPVISIRDDDPAEEIARLEPMLTELNEVIEMLWMEVEALRSELARARGVVDAEVPATFDRPPTRVPPAPSGNVDADRRTLRLLVDDLNGSAETLWYESQWIRSQLASLLEDVRGLSDSAWAWRRRS